MEIVQLIKEGTEVLRKHGIENPEIDTQLLLGHCLDMSRTQLYLHGKDLIPDETVRKFMQLLTRRSAREPVAYILSEREFFSRSFFVTPDVLIPRPETEFLLERVIAEVKDSDQPIDCCLDLCCGSGVIAVTLALELNIEVIAVDYSIPALAVAERNILDHGVEKIVIPIFSDLFSALDCHENVFPLIVSNPPYVRRGEIISNLEPEVAKFEPNLALDGGEDGLQCIRKIASDVLRYLTPGGMFFMEFGSDQGSDVKDIFSTISDGNRHFTTVDILKDYSSRDRVVFAKANFY